MKAISVPLQGLPAQAQSRMWQPIIRTGRAIAVSMLVVLLLLTASPIFAAPELRQKIRLIDQASGDVINLLPLDLAGHLQQGDRLLVRMKAASEDEVTIDIIETSPVLIDVSGRYVSDISSQSHWSFRQKYRHMEIELTQSGDLITGIDKRYETKIHGRIRGETIDFFIPPGQASGYYDAEGSWNLGKDASRLKGDWVIRGSPDAASGKWDLVKLDNETRKAGFALSIRGRRVSDQSDVEIALSDIESIETLAQPGPPDGVYNQADEYSGLVQGDSSGYAGREDAGQWSENEAIEVSGSESNQAWPASEQANSLAVSLSNPPRVSFELGVFTLLGADFQLGYRLADSPWLFGFKYAKWKEKGFYFIVDETTTTISGPVLRYLMNPDSRETFYLAASLLHRSVEVECLNLVDSDKQSSTGLYIGGGFTRPYGRQAYYNIGFLFKPGGGISTNTSCSSTEESGEVDINLSFGFGGY